MVRIGIDIGGTKVNMGLLTEEGAVLQRKKLVTRSAANPEELVQDIAAGIHEMLENQGLTLEDVRFIGAGVPGTVDWHTGLVSYCPNLGWYDIPIGEYFKNALGREVLVYQDSRNGALAEKLFGAGRAFEDLICITIGTGIGCGVVLGGKVLHGGMNTAGELGHIAVIKDGEKCACGSRGCLERYVSGTAIGRIAVERFPEKFADRPKTCEEVFALALAGDQDMLGVIDEAMDNLASGLASAVNLLSPEAIIISGGLSVYEDLVINPLRKKVYDRGYFSWTRLKKLQIITAELGSDAPMIGAGLIDKSL